MLKGKIVRIVNMKDTRKICFFNKQGRELLGSDGTIWLHDNRIKRASTIHEKARKHAVNVRMVAKEIAGHRIHTGHFNDGTGRYSKPVYFYYGHPDWMPKTIDGTTY